MSDDLTPGKQPTVRVVKMKDFKPDPRNVNVHTQRGQRIVTESMSKRGFGRPGLAAKDGTVLAGNLSVIEVAADLGMDEVIVVESDGKRPIVHMRTDIDPNSFEAYRMALEDNRAAQVSIDYDPKVLRALSQEQPNLVEGLWNRVEWADIIVEASSELPVVDDGMFAEQDGFRGSTGSVVVVGFGRYAGVVSADLVLPVIEMLKVKFGEDANPAMEVICRAIFEGGLLDVLPELKDIEPLRAVKSPVREAQPNLVGEDLVDEGEQE